MKQQLSAILFAIIFTAMATPAWATGDESVIIDVRTLDEWNAGHLATAQHLQLDLVAQSIETAVVQIRISRFICTAVVATDLGRLR